MRIFTKIILLLFIIIQMMGCSSGNDGDLFLRFRAVIEPVEFIIDNPDIPDYPEYDIYYKTNPGSYAFSYVDHNGTQHPQPGEFGFVELIADPASGSEDGKDLYIDLILLSTGPLIENFDYYTIASTLEFDD